MINNINKPIFLCGMMGSGKSTIGKLLAQKLSTVFCDLDHEIVRREGSYVSEIFTHRGEEYFRNIEREILLQKAKMEKGVVALGGGSLQDQKITTHLKEKGWLIFLDAPLSVLSNRLKNATNRPLLQTNNKEANEEKIRKLLNFRRPLYTQSHFKIDVSEKTAQDIADLIIENILSHAS